MTSSEDAAPRAIAPIIAGLMLSMFVVALDSTIVSTAMPSIVGNLGGFKLYAWVPAIYLLTTAVSTPIYGKLSDLFGRKPVLFFGIGVFLLGSVLSGAAQSMLLLIIFRAIQGIGAGAVFPTTITIIGDIFTLEQRAKYQGFFSSVWGVSSVVGPLLGGFLVDSVGWRWIFYLNLPVGVLAMGMIAWAFKEHPVHREHKLDIAGAAYLTIGLTSILLFLIEGGQAWAWISWQSVGLVILTVATLLLFVREEQRAPEPTIPLDLFGSRIITVSVIGSFFAGIVMIGVNFEVPLYAQGVLGQDALHAGLALAPMSIGWPLAGAFAGQLALRFGYRATASAGMLLCIVGVALLLTLGLHTSYVVASGFSFFVGVGLGLSSNPMLVAIQSAVLWTRRGVATATNMFVRNFGAVVGLAIMGAIINHVTGRLGAASATSQALDVHARAGVSPAVLAQIHQTLMNGLHVAFLSGLVAAIIGTLVVLRLPGGSAREHALEETAAMPPADLREAGG